MEPETQAAAILVVDDDPTAPAALKRDAPACWAALTFVSGCWTLPWKAELRGRRRARASRGARRAAAPDSVAGQVATAGAVLVLEDGRTHPGWRADPHLADRPNLLAYLGAPVFRAHVALGTIAVVREVGAPFTPDDERLLVQLANAAAVAISAGPLWRQVHPKTDDAQQRLDPELAKASSNAPEA